MTGPILENAPAALREVYGIRFHHFHDLKGRLVATIATEPLVADSLEPGEEPQVAVAAAILFRGTDPVKALMVDIERAVREDRRGEAYHLIDIAHQHIKAGNVKEADVPSRSRGRAVALGRLFDVDAEPCILPESVLKEEIANRTILKRFPGGKGLVLRPRQPFKGSKR